MIELTKKLIDIIYEKTLESGDLCMQHQEIIKLIVENDSLIEKDFVELIKHIASNFN